MNNSHGFTAWPSDSPLGGGGYVDLTGEKNAPAKPATVSSTDNQINRQQAALLSVPTVADWVKRMTVGQTNQTATGLYRWHYDPYTDSLVKNRISDEDFYRQSPGSGYALVETDGGLCWLPVSVVAKDMPVTYFGGGPGGARADSATSAKFQQAFFNNAVNALEGNAFIRAVKTQYAKSEKAPEQIPFPEPGMASIALMGELRDATARWFGSL